MICSGNEDDTERLYALNELTDEQLREHFENRVELTQDDIEYADYVWQLYCSDNPIRLENLINNDDFQFEYLPDALKTHLKRFPTIKNGLNELENHVLDVVTTQKPKSRRELLGNLLSNQGFYGFGDSQYERIITSLRPLFSSFDPVKLTKKGKEVLENKTNYYSQIRDNQLYLGGSLKYNFLYNTDTNRILKL